MNYWQLKLKTKVLETRRKPKMSVDPFEATRLKPVLEKIQLTLQPSFLGTISDYEKEPKPVSGDMLNKTLELHL